MLFFRLFAAFFGTVAVTSAGLVPTYTDLPVQTAVVGQTYTAAVPAVTGFSKTISYGAPTSTVVSAPTVQKTLSTIYAAPASISKTISYASSAPVSTTVVSAVPTAAASVAAPAAAVHKTFSYGLTPVQRVVPQTPAKLSFHQVVLGNRQRDVRVEEYQRPEQLIRIQEGAQLQPEVVKFNVPSEEQATVRVINRPAPPPRVEHVVAKKGGLQIYNIEKPANPADRVIHITRGAASPARVEFYSEGQDTAAEITLSDTPNRPHVKYTGAAYSAPIGPGSISYAAPTAVPTTVVAPAAPAVQKTMSYATPGSMVVATPAVHKTTLHAAPWLSYTAPVSAVQNTIPYSTSAVQNAFFYASPEASTAVATAPAVQKTVSYNAPAVEKTISYRAPTVQNILSYSVPALEQTTSYGAAGGEQTTSYGASTAEKGTSYPTMQKTAPYNASVASSPSKIVSYESGNNYANTYKTTSDDFRRAGRNL